MRSELVYLKNDIQCVVSSVKKKLSKNKEKSRQQIMQGMFTRVDERYKSEILSEIRKKWNEKIDKKETTSMLDLVEQAKELIRKM